MRNRSSLLLMELLVMLLIFALAAALCLQMFAKATLLSEQTGRRDEAVLLAQNAAERLKAAGGETPSAEALSGNGYLIEITKLETTVPGLGLGEITVTYDGELLFTLRTGWQEVGP